MSILLVEDDRDLADLWCEYLRSKGHRTEVRHTVADANAEITSRPPSLLIVDYTLPDGTAVEVIDHLRQQGHPCRIVVCSGRGSDLPNVDAQEGIEILAKPFRLDELDAQILSLLPPGSSEA